MKIEYVRIPANVNDLQLGDKIYPLDGSPVWDLDTDEKVRKAQSYFLGRMSINLRPVPVQNQEAVANLLTLNPLTLEDRVCLLNKLPDDVDQLKVIFRWVRGNEITEEEYLALTAYVEYENEAELFKLTTPSKDNWSEL